MLTRGHELIRSTPHKGSLEVVERSTHRVQSRVSLRGDSEREVLSGQLVSARGKVFVDAVFTKRLEVFELATLEPVGFVPKSDDSGNLCVALDESHVAYAGSTGLSIIDPVELRARTIAYREDLKGSGACAFSPDGTMVYVAIQRPVSTLLPFDLDRDQWLPAVPLTSSTLAIPCAMVFSADGSRLYVGLFQGQELVVVDPRKNAVIQRRSMPDPLALSLTPDALFVVTREPRPALTSLDPLSLEVRREVPLEGNAQGALDVHAAGDDVVVDTNREEGELTWLTVDSMR